MSEARERFNQTWANIDGTLNALEAATARANALNEEWSKLQSEFDLRSSRMWLDADPEERAEITKGRINVELADLSEQCRVKWLEFDRSRSETECLKTRWDALLIQAKYLFL